MIGVAGAAGDWLRGACCLVDGLRMVLRPGLRRYVVVPLGIDVVLFSAGLWAVWAFVSGWLDTLLPPWLAWLEWVLLPLLVLAAGVAVFFVVALLANLVAAPFNDALAVAVARSLGHQAADRDAGVLAAALRSLGDEAAKLGWFALRALPLLVLFVVPGLQPVAALAWTLFAVWALALEYLDYPLSLAGLAFADQRRIGARRRPLVLGFGTATAALTALPLANFVAMPAAVAGAVILWHRHLREAA